MCSKDKVMLQCGKIDIRDDLEMKVFVNVNK